MITVTLREPDDLAEFRGAARRLLAAAIPPPDIAWTTTGSLFSNALPIAEKTTLVPRAFAGPCSMKPFGGSTAASVR
jgi:hypothetical protein